MERFALSSVTFTSACRGSCYTILVLCLPVLKRLLAGVGVVVFGVACWSQMPFD